MILFTFRQVMADNEKRAENYRVERHDQHGGMKARTDEYKKDQQTDAENNDRYTSGKLMFPCDEQANKKNQPWYGVRTVF